MSKVRTKLSRSIGLTTLVATGVCSMFGASIYIVPFMIQRNIPGIGQWVLPAFLFAAIPALLAALAYAALSSSMPRAGGSYIYASRGLNPYLGFIASFSQWFGLSIVIGVIAYIIIPFFRDISTGLGMLELARFLENAWVRILLSLALIWGFVWVNIRGVKWYKKALLPMMYLMFALASIVIFSGLIFDSSDFISKLEINEGRSFEATSSIDFNWKIFLSASALLFSSFIGFDSIAQAGSEARNPSVNLPRAILIAILGVACVYFLFTASVYHIIPWSFVAEESLKSDITAPGLLNYVLPSFLGVIILLGAAIALVNDLPAMILSVSRLMFAWAEDGIFPKSISTVHSKFRTPHIALIVAGCIASIGVLGSHFAGDFFLGIDIMVTAMMVNFLLMCLTLLMIPKLNSVLYSQISVLKSRWLQMTISISGIVLISLFLVMHTYKDLNTELTSWYFHSTYVYLTVMTFASLIFYFQWRILKKSGINIKTYFSKLPNE